MVKMDNCPSTELELMVYVSEIIAFPPTPHNHYSETHQPITLPPTIQLHTSMRSQLRRINSHPHKALSASQPTQIKSLNLFWSLPIVESLIINHTNSTRSPQDIQILPISSSIQATRRPTERNNPIDVPRAGINERDGGGTAINDKNSIKPVGIH